MKRAAVATALACLCAMAPAQSASAWPPLFPTTIDLPAGFRPEGITIGVRPVMYVGSTADGSIYRADLVTGHGEILSRGPGTPSLGLRLDNRGRLFIAGGSGGDARVLDARTGRMLASYRLALSGDTVVNDVVITPTGAWFTDSRTPVLYHLPFGPDGTLPPSEEVVRVRLSGDIAYVPATFNANGIVRTPDSTGLILVQSVTGHLFRVDPANGHTRKVDLGTEAVPHGDGLLLHGNTLFVVQNRLDTIAVVTLDRTGATGTVERHITDPRLDVPTTVAQFGGRLYLPNARYDTTPKPATPYTAVALEPRHRLSPREGYSGSR
ncbi:superoxide dismutase [Nocardia sp. NPDC050378]|uniref:SMP-30/gluconolactonase/LRE family protein n=1 Tax=Nocardia sp. NPDC050378 TaxID=3155400 RepID=UPI0033CDEE25